jgi:hypothetical protein
MPRRERQFLSEIVKKFSKRTRQRGTSHERTDTSCDYCNRRLPSVSECVECRRGSEQCSQRAPHEIGVLPGARRAVLQLVFESFDAAFRTFAAVFPHATFWYVRGHGLFVAAKNPIQLDCTRITERFNTPAVKNDFASIEVQSPEEFVGFMLMDESHIAGYLARNQDRQIATDDNAYLEYATPLEFMGRTEDIVPDLIAHAGWDKDLFSASCSPEFRDGAQSYFSKRLERIVPELAEPIR